jgi:hypothetical protein
MMQDNVLDTKSAMKEYGIVRCTTVSKGQAIQSYGILSGGGGVGPERTMTEQ